MLNQQHELGKFRLSLVSTPDLCQQLFLSHYSSSGSTDVIVMVLGNWDLHARLIAVINPLVVFAHFLDESYNP